MRLLALLVTLLIVLTACGDAQPPKAGPDSTAPKAGQEAFPAASHRVPDGFHQELCPDLRSKSSGLAIRLAVPDDYQVEVYKYRNSCRFVAELDRDFSVSMNSHESLRHYEEKWVDPDVGYEGDTGTGDIAYDADAEVYGDRRGELLTWGSNNDGLPLDNRLMQADGVRLAWHTPRGKSRRWAEELATVTASIGVVESQRGHLHRRRCHRDVHGPASADRRHRQLRRLLPPVPEGAGVAAPVRRDRPGPAPIGGGARRRASRAAQRRIGGARAGRGLLEQAAGGPADLGRGATAPHLGRSGGHLATGHDRPRRPARDVGRDAGPVAARRGCLRRLRRVGPAQSCTAFAIVTHMVR